MGLRASSALSESSNAGTFNLDASVISRWKDGSNVLIDRADTSHGG